MNIFERIAEQQKGKEGTPEWTVGEQLKDICRDPACARIVEKDLEAIPIGRAAEKIGQYADELHRKNGGKCICVTPDVAERIIRETYGLPEADAKKRQEPEAAAKPQKETGSGFLNLTDFL